MEETRQFTVIDLMDNFIAAVIVLALKQYEDQTGHDNESYIITIKKK